MNQAERSSRSRKAILKSALRLFSTRGYGATSVRDIAEAARLSTGNVYHHFPDKDALFRALLDEYWAAIDDPDLPFNRALASHSFPDNLEELGHVTREFVCRYRPYVALIYVDVVEFGGRHIRKFYSEMARRFSDFIEAHGTAGEMAHRLRDGISPTSAVMLASRFFLNFFAVEVLFGVPNHFGKSTEAVIGEIATILRYGMLRNGDAAQPAIRAVTAPGRAGRRGGRRPAAHRTVS
jgi:AcrR family transcriptional regulator